MGLFDKLFSRGKAKTEPAPESGGGFRVISSSSEEVNRNADEMGEMYYDCPKCKTAQRVNNIGKMMLKANPGAFRNMTCPKCNHAFDAGPRVKFGKCPGFDYSKL